MEKEIVLVRVNDRSEIVDILSELSTNDIQYRKCMMTNQINTKNIIIKFVIIPISNLQMDYVKSMRATGCFGFDDNTADYVTRGNNICKDYTLVKYVKEINEMGY